MEKFKIVDFKIGESQKDHKNYYYLVLYSDLEYLVHAYLSEKDFNELKRTDLSDFDISSILIKRYNRNNNTFSYYINLG